MIKRNPIIKSAMKSAFYGYLSLIIAFFGILILGLLIIR